MIFYVRFLRIRHPHVKNDRKRNVKTFAVFDAKRFFFFLYYVFHQRNVQIEMSWKAGIELFFEIFFSFNNFESNAAFYERLFKFGGDYIIWNKKLFSIKILPIKSTFHENTSILNETLTQKLVMPQKGQWTARLGIHRANLKSLKLGRDAFLRNWNGYFMKFFGYYDKKNVWWLLPPPLTPVLAHINSFCNYISNRGKVTAVTCRCNQGPMLLNFLHPEFTND